MVWSWKITAGVSGAWCAASTGTSLSSMVADILLEVARAQLPLEELSRRGARQLAGGQADGGGNLEPRQAFGERRAQALGGGGNVIHRVDLDHGRHLFAELGVGEAH